MARISFSIVFLAIASITTWAALPDSVRRTRALVLQQADLKLTPAALVFDEKGELYVGYRDKGVYKKSSAIWIRVFDPADGKELRSIQLQTAATPLPDGAEQFLLSPDNSLLQYSQFYGGTLVAMFNAVTLQNLSETTNLPKGIEGEFPKAVGIDPSDSSLFLSAEITNRLNGVDVRLISLDARDLDHVLSDRTLTNPIPESGYVVAASEAVWIVRGNGLYRYDPDTEKANLVASIHNQDDIRGVLFARDHWLLAWSNQNEFGYLYRFEVGAAQPEESQRIEKDGVVSVRLSPDQQYGVALCEHRSDLEWNFGAITFRTAVIFDTKTLKILAQVPIEKDLYPELAIWHGRGKIVLATQDSPDKLAIYELAAP